MTQKIDAIRFGREQFIEKLQAAGITQEEMQTARSQGPEAFKQLLESHGIQAPPPPPRPENDNNDEEANEFIEKLKALGIPEEIIKQGPEAVKKYAEQHNITLPEPPEHKNKSGCMDNLQSVINELKTKQVAL